MAFIDDDGGWFRPQPIKKNVSTVPARNATPNNDVPDPFSRVQQNFIPSRWGQSGADTTPAVEDPVIGGGTPAVEDPVGGGSPAAAAAAAAGRWVTPNYASLIPDAWELAAATAQGNQWRGTAEADFQKLFRQAFIDRGEGPGGWSSDYDKYIDEPTQEAAKANKFSRSYMNRRAWEKASRQLRAQYGARGISSSGANTQGMRNLLEAKQEADYLSNRQFLGQADEGYRSVAGVGERIAEAMRNARRDAAARLAAENPSYWDPNGQ